MTLAAGPHSHHFLATNPRPSIRPSPANAARSYLPNSAIVTIQHRRRASLLDPPPSNPHSARSAATLQPSAVSSLGGFPTPALTARGARQSLGRHPKPCTVPAKTPSGLLQ